MGKGMSEAAFILEGVEFCLSPAPEHPRLKRNRSHHSRRASSSPCWVPTARARPPWPTSSTPWCCPLAAGWHPSAWTRPAEDNLWEVRRLVGMVLQNPDHQIIGPTVEDDIAFGLENLGLERQVMHETVERVMEELELEPLREREPHFLSSGQKQKLALAGVLAMSPRAIVSDESTALLDPASRAEVLERLRALSRERGTTLLHITHRLEEALAADRVLVLREGRTGFRRATGGAAARARSAARAGDGAAGPGPPGGAAARARHRPARSGARLRRGGEAALSLILRDVEFTYLPGTPLEYQALAGIDLEIKQGRGAGRAGFHRQRQVHPAADTQGHPAAGGRCRRAGRRGSGIA